MQTPIGWTLADWQNAYKNPTTCPKALVLSLLQQIPSHDNSFITLLNSEALAQQMDTLLENPKARALPLFGIPFAVKDNIDCAGIPTTAACEAFSYSPQTDAYVVAKLKAAGAIVIGKTNLDQFATGLVGTRSPYGAVKNAFNADYISGGSSSGSAVCVAKGWVPFSLGTDTAGSGRVPAGLNNIVGLKPTKGRFSTQGLVPACRTLDCISIFALTVDDANTLATLLEGFNPEDAYSRKAPAYSPPLPARLKLGYPAQLSPYMDTPNLQAWQASLDLWPALNIDLIPIDFTPMHALANLLYNGPWVAERYAALKDFVATHPQDLHPVIARILASAENYSASDCFLAEYQKAALSQQIQQYFTQVDALLVPTAPHFPRLQQVLDNPIELNSQLGAYTNFVNLADLSALSVPAGFRDDGLPFGVTLIAPAWQDALLAKIGQDWQQRLALPLGATGLPLPEAETVPLAPKGYMPIAVVGAHLTGMPLNSQLTERQAQWVCTTHTAPLYRLYALANSTPPKPGLCRVTQDGAAIAVEVWHLPLEHWGSFLQLIPAPLGLGTLVLATGETVKGFICEPIGLQDACDITAFGGWKAYLNAPQTP